MAPGKRVAGRSKSPCLDSKNPRFLEGTLSAIGNVPLVLTATNGHDWLLRPAPLNLNSFLSCHDPLWWCIWHLLSPLLNQGWKRTVLADPILLRLSPVNFATRWDLAALSLSLSLFSLPLQTNPISPDPSTFLTRGSANCLGQEGNTLLGCYEDTK